MPIKNLSVRIEEELLAKLHAIADYEHRSVNGQILTLIRDSIKDYETKLTTLEEKLKESTKPFSGGRV